jgi:hypothetical protein
MPAKKLLMLVGDYVEDYEAMVPFQALLMVGHVVHAVCPNKRAGESVRTAIHDFGRPDIQRKAGAQFHSERDFRRCAAGELRRAGGSGRARARIHPAERASARNSAAFRRRRQADCSHLPRGAIAGCGRRAPGQDLQLLSSRRTRCNARGRHFRGCCDGSGAHLRKTRDRSGLAGASGVAGAIPESAGDANRAITACGARHRSGKGPGQWNWLWCTHLACRVDNRECRRRKHDCSRHIAASAPAGSQFGVAHA